VNESTHKIELFRFREIPAASEEERRAALAYFQRRPLVTRGADGRFYVLEREGVRRVQERKPLISPRRFFSILSKARKVLWR